MFIEDPEAATLDRQFRLLREDLCGSVRDELVQEFRRPEEQRRRAFSNPRVVGLGTKPEPHVKIQVEMPQGIAGRVLKLNGKDRKSFFDPDGPGRRVLAQGSLVLLVEPSPASKKTAPAKGRRGGEATQQLELHDLLSNITAVGTIVERRDMTQKTEPSKGGYQRLVLEIGVRFTPESMSAIAPLLEGLDHKKKGTSVRGVLFNSSTGLFDYEPVLGGLRRMDSIPLRYCC
jgi:hypothetical protein